MDPVTRPRLPPATSTSGKPACGSAARRTRTRCFCRARLSDCPEPSRVSARSNRSDRDRPGFLWERLHPGSSRRVRCGSRSALRRPPDTSRPGVSGGDSTDRPPCRRCRLSPPATTPGVSAVWSVVTTTADPGLADRGHRGPTPTRAPSIAGPTVEPGQQDHRRPNKQARTGDLPSHNLSPGLRHRPKPEDRRGSRPVRTVAPSPMRANPRLRWQRPFAATRWWIRRGCLW